MRYPGGGVTVALLSMTINLKFPHTWEPSECVRVQTVMPSALHYVQSSWAHGDACP